jgi:conjugal transfer pilus assembly protein TraV
MKFVAGWVVPVMLAMTGCASMTGLDGQGSFSCKAPDGISCASLSGVYANAVQNNLPGQRTSGKADKDMDKVPETKARIDAAALRSGDPLRSAQQVRRVWLAPWEDEDEVLHDQSYFYLVVDPGRWQIEHSRRKATESYRPVVPPRAFSPQSPPTGERQALQMERTERTPPSTGTFPMNTPPSQPLRTLPNGPGEVE